MRITFTLDDSLHASLIAKIKVRAGKNSVHKAALLMMAEWSYFEDMSLNGQKPYGNCMVSVENDENKEINLSGLDSLL